MYYHIWCDFFIAKGFTVSKEKLKEHVFNNELRRVVVVLLIEETHLSCFSSPGNALRRKKRHGLAEENK